MLEGLGSGAWLTAGIYQVIVADEGGCEGRRTFLLSQTAASIPEALNVTALCGDEAFDPVEFTGGFASPSEGYLSFQLTGSTGNGWGGSYLDVQIIHEDGTVTTSTVSLASGTFANINDDPDLAIVYGDSIQVTYISADPSNDQFNSFDMFNCVQNCIGDNANSSRLRRPVIWPVVLRSSAVSSSACIGHLGGDVELGQQHIRQP